jgi:hypothetical protein
MPEGNIRMALLGEVARPGEENVGRRRPGFRGAPSRSGRISPRSPASSLCRVTSASPTPPMVDLLP